MNETGIPAAANDVEALILGDAFANDDETCIADAVDREVSMRGDLQQMPLADVFQSLGMSKMEGVLRVQNLVETREIYFRDGTVRGYIPARVELRRIGVQLVQGGLMTPETLRTVLFEHKKSRHDLRALLVEHRVLPEAEIEDLFDHRAAEELYGLFTWTQGSFEFYKGPPTDPVVTARFDELKPFDINVVLMEVARRSDEWEVILDAIRSVDELLLPMDGVAPVKGDHLEVRNALDGRRTIRMLAPSMLFGLFELSRIIRDLLEAGQARFATVPEALEAIRFYLEHGRKKLASALLDTLTTRPEHHSYADLHAIATLLQEAGEQKRAAHTLLTAAREAEDAASALEMLRDARALAPRSCEVLEQLRARLQALGDPERDDELRQTTDDLCNALIEDGRLNDALTILEQLETASPEDSRLTFRRAIVLHKLGRRDEAITGLMTLAERLKAAKQRDQLAIVYEQVLKIDPRRRDVTRALRTIQATRIVRRLRMAALATVLLGAIGAGVVGWRSHRQTQVMTAATADVQALLNRGDVEGANAVVERTRSELGDLPDVTELRSLIDAHFASRREAAARAAFERRRELLASAAALFEKADFAPAMDAYSAILAETDEAGAAEVREVVRARCQSLLPAFERLAQELPYAVPPPPTPTTDARARRQAIEDLQVHFQDADLVRARACLRAIEHELFRRCADQDTGTRLTKACTEVVRAFGLADLRRTAYQSLEASAEVGRRLQPLVVQANRLEAQHRYKEAADAYATLAREHPHEDDLKQEFRKRAERSAKIAAGLEAIAAATAAADAKAARAALEALSAEFPDVPLRTLVRLPLAVVTRPPGAEVRIGNESMGTTPLHASFVPELGAAVRIERSGYEPFQTRIAGDEVSDLVVTLVKQPDWVATTVGAITQTPTGHGKAVIAVDRSGRVTALDLVDGTEQWHLDTGDFSGLLPRPVAIGDHLIVGSVDGTLRCLAARDGRVLWQRPDLPLETAPLAVGELCIAAVADGRIVALEARTGEPRYQVTVPGQPTGLALHDRTVACLTAQGDLMALSASEGKIAWRASLGGAASVPPAVVAGAVCVVGEGVVAGFDLATGRELWRQAIGSVIPVAPAARADALVVAANDDVLWLAGKSGQVRRRVRVGEPVTSVSWLGELLLVGTSQGTVTLLDTSGEVLRLRGPGRVSASPLVFGGWVVVGFEGKRLQAYRSLP